MCEGIKFVIDNPLILLDDYHPLENAGLVSALFCLCCF